MSMWHGPLFARTFKTNQAESVVRRIMRRTIRRWPAVLALLAIVASFLGVTTPGTAYATGSEFAMSQNSGRPGMTTVISQADPCATVRGNPTQAVHASFTDASNTVLVSDYSITTTTGTAWQASAHFPIPLTAATGTGTVRVWCTQVGKTTHTLDYDPPALRGIGISR